VAAGPQVCPARDSCLARDDKSGTQVLDHKELSYCLTGDVPRRHSVFVCWAHTRACMCMRVRACDSVYACVHSQASVHTLNNPASSS